jgi:hypothetical protein
MFFRRSQPKPPSFEERLQTLRGMGFEITRGAGGGAVRARRGSCAIDLREEGGVGRFVGRAGIEMNGEIGVLVDGGFQKFFRAPSGLQKPALAEELKDLHDFEEDLKEAFGVTSLYNDGLGTVSTYYLYDRVQDRDRGVPKRAWE